jgi:hypothetical protein
MAYGADVAAVIAATIAAAAAPVLARGYARLKKLRPGRRYHGRHAKPRHAGKGALAATGEVLDDPDRRAVLQHAASSTRPSGWTPSQRVAAAAVILVALDVVLPLRTGVTAETIYGNILQTLIVVLALAACIQGPGV